MIVMKFGGTSVESRKAMERVANIVRERLDRQLNVVVSAMGKTDEQAARNRRRSGEGDREQAIAALNDLRDFHLREAAGLPATLQVEVAVEKHFEEPGRA